MPYRRRNRGFRLRPVNSVKNIVDATNIGTAAGTNVDVTVVNTVDAYAGAASDVPIGASVKGLYLFFQIIPQAAQGNVDWYIAKANGPIGTGGFPAPGATGGSPYRKFILHEEKGIPGTFNNGASPLTFRGVIKIPPKMSRMADADRIFIRARGATVIDSCLKCIYKFYR